ncbi:MAG TPA: hypothetical protein VKK31_23710 [Thermoanaerobaculia bacterium]|nr:hypothetical protein [Thermoanaerobaculia bacterium]
MRILKWTCGSLLVVFGAFLLFVGFVAYLHDSTPPAASPHAGVERSAPPRLSKKKPAKASEKERTTSNAAPPLPEQKGSFNLAIKELFFRQVPDIGWVPRFSHASDVGNPRKTDDGNTIYAVSVAEEDATTSSSQNAEIEVLASRDGATIYSVTATFGLNENNGPYLLPDDITTCYMLLTKLIGAVSPDCEELGGEPYHRFTQAPFQNNETRNLHLCDADLRLTVTPRIVGAELTVRIEPPPTG